MKFSTFLLAEHVTVVNGLVNVLNGGAAHLMRPVYPAPLGLQILCMVQAPPDYAGDEIAIAFTVTDPDGDSIFGRLDGGFGFDVHGQTDRRTMNAPLVVDLGDVVLPRSGTYKVTGFLNGEPKGELYVQVSTEPL